MMLSHFTECPLRYSIHHTLDRTGLDQVVKHNKNENEISRGVGGIGGEHACSEYATVRVRRTT
ncbi:MAG: hypothetical protein JWR35_3698 [Marmoricola sp.]|nr:hypothetical protein [Marmoricola sp.]